MQIIDGPAEGFVTGVPLSDPSCNTLHCNPPAPANMTCAARDILYAQNLCNQGTSSNVTCSARSGETSVFTPGTAMRADVLFRSLYYQAYHDLFHDIFILTGSIPSTQLVEGLVNQAVDNLGNNQLTSINVLNTTYAYTIFMRADIAISEGRKCWNCLCGPSLRAATPYIMWKLPKAMSGGSVSSLGRRKLQWGVDISSSGGVTVDTPSFGGAVGQAGNVLSQTGKDLTNGEDWSKLKSGLATASNAYTNDVEKPIMKGTRDLSKWAEGVINDNCVTGPVSSALGTAFKTYTGVGANPSTVIGAAVSTFIDGDPKEGAQYANAGLTTWTQGEGGHWLDPEYFPKVAACGAGMYFEQETDNIQGRNGCDDGQAMYKSVTGSLDHGQWQAPANWAPVAVCGYDAYKSSTAAGCQQGIADYKYTKDNFQTGTYQSDWNAVSCLQSTMETPPPSPPSSGSADSAGTPSDSSDGNTPNTPTSPSGPSLPSTDTRTDAKRCTDTQAPSLPTIQMG